MALSDRQYEELKSEWIDQYVEVNPTRPELARFTGRVGRVITVNYNGNAIIDFQDGAWYDIVASMEFLNRLNPDEGRSRYNAKINSAQPFPVRQG